jgi:hypothetical protein
MKLSEGPAGIPALCINLDRRQDRWSDFSVYSASSGFADVFELSRFSAVEDSDFPELGCVKSHHLALATHLSRANHDLCAVFEDDFSPRIDGAALQSKIQDFRKTGTEWDVIMLAGTYLRAFPAAETGFARVYEAMSASGYIVRRKYLHRLISCIGESIIEMERYRRSANRTQLVSPFMHDVAWKRLQRLDQWFIHVPAFGSQRPSHSDIIGRTVDYSKVSA